MAKRFPTDGFADVLIGLQHGDEGKGRFVDGLAYLYQIFVRYNGGANAGHTIMIGNKCYALHQVPSGVHHPDKKLYIASQCVVNLEKLCAEIEELERAGLLVSHRLRISAQATVVQPGHIIEDRETMGSVGTTGNGIGVAYAGQDLRVRHDHLLNIRLGDLLVDTDHMFTMMEKNLKADVERFDIKNFDVTGTMERQRKCFEKIKGCIDKDPFYLLKEIRNGMHILLEGAQAFGLDKTYGVTPDVTSSNTGVQAAFLSAGIPVEFKRNAYGVAKGPPSRVGHGPFVTAFGGKLAEQHCMADGGMKFTRDVEQRLFGERVDEMLASTDMLDVGIALRMKGGEYGASTGRPRRLGMIDLVQLRYAAILNGIDGIFLTKGDQLAHFSKTHNGLIPMVHAYNLDGKVVDEMPTTKAELSRATPIIRGVPAFARDISGVRNVKELPRELLHVVDEMQNFIETDILAVGVGPGRDQVVHLSSL